MATAKTNGERRRPARKRRSDGERSRAAILDKAGQLATVEGLGGLSIARLADEVGISKSGVFAHFGSKQELQLATIDTATGVFEERVLAPASAAPSGLERLRLLAGNYLGYVQGGLYAGGCFFASVVAEMDTQAGPVRDRAVGVIGDFVQRIEAAVRDAQAEGAIDPSEETGQLAFELASYLFFANAQFVIRADPIPIERARRALEARIAVALDA
jgi:AcrR family transcriptional regulator